MTLACRVSIITFLLLCSCSQGGGEDRAETAKDTVKPSPTMIIERAPTLEEAQAAGAKCGVKVHYYNGTGRPALWALYLPVDATAEQEECYFSQIRQSLVEPTKASVQ